MRTAIWWIRRDLRLTDNHALSAALIDSESIIPVFILDPRILKSKNNSNTRNTFLFAGLHKLDIDLQSIGSRLYVLSGDPIDVLPNLFSSIGASNIYAEEDFTPYARKRDHLIESKLPLQRMGGQTIFPPGSILKSDGTAYTIYTPFKRSWLSKLQDNLPTLHPKPTQIKTPEIGQIIQETPVPQLELSLPFQAGESEAIERLRDFTRGDYPHIYNYDAQRNLLDTEGTSQLSPYIRFGMLSAGQVVQAAIQALNTAPDSDAQKGAEAWLTELIWREFYIHILFHFPIILKQNFRRIQIRWENNPRQFKAWCDGQTGYPIVDAAMRQLISMGWMHNRVRMIVASFLTKDLLIDWKWGESWFIKNLIDGDLAANNGGWQWTAGTGTDAAPYFRIFNPVLQSKKYDPHGLFIRRWIPELATVPSKYVHEPWKMPDQVQKVSQCVIGKSYPKPIIDHAFARSRALDVFYQAKSSQGI